MRASVGALVTSSHPPYSPNPSAANFEAQFRAGHSETARVLLWPLVTAAITADAMLVKTTPREQDEAEQDPKDREMEEILRLGENSMDEETRQFIEEVLKFVPREPQPEIRIFTSHQGAGDAG